MDESKVLETVKKLLARTVNNPYEAEAHTCLLKAQRLMAEHGISMEEANGKVLEQYETVVAESKWNMGFRRPLAKVIADNFRCIYFLRGNSCAFMGHPIDARIAKEAFEFAYDFAMREGNRLYNKAYSAGEPTKGVFNSYTIGFIKGMRIKLEEQSTALVLVTPKDVKDKFEEMSAGWKTAKGKLTTTNMDVHAYHQGVHDGKTVMNGKRLAGGDK